MSRELLITLISKFSDKLGLFTVINSRRRKCSHCNVFVLVFVFLPDTISLARAQEDFNAPDCRFINVKKGQQIYVYSKLVKENGAGEFWAGSVRGDSYKYTYILTYGALNFFSGTYLQCIVMFKTSSLEQWRDGRQVHKFTDICFYRMSKKQRQFRNKAKCRRM